MSTYFDLYQSGTHADFAQEHRRTGSLGVYFIKAEQEPHDFVDPAMGEIVVQCVIKASGTSSIHLGDRWIDISHVTGKILLSPPDTAVGYRVPCKHELLIAAFPKQNLADALAVDASQLAGKFNGVYEQPFRDPTIFAMVQRMWDASKSGDSASALYVDSAAIAVAALLQGRAGGVVESEQKSKLSKKALERVVDFIAAHLGEALALGDLAAVACMSSFHFSRCFKATTGKSPLAYVMEQRIEFAKTLLLSNEMSIAQVAYISGFANQAHFTTTFRKHVGMTPGQFRG